MTDLDLDHFRKRLLDERGRVVGAIEYLHQEAPSASEDEAQESSMNDHLADSASITLERELDFTLEENSEQLLAAIDRALARIDDGTYGLCVTCGKEIPVERLEAVPYAEQCIDDARGGT